MAIPTEPVGSIPRPLELIEGVKAFESGTLTRDELDKLYDRAVRDTIRRFDETGSPVITDGEQTKPSFATYPIHGLKNLAAGGVSIAFADGHTRQLPRLISGPFRYLTYADRYLAEAKKHTRLPIKQAVIAASALSLIYPNEGIEGYSKEEFLDDLVNEAETDIRRCLEQGAYKVQIDFTEGRLAIKLDPSRRLLQDFVALNNRVLARFTSGEISRIGIHTCPGGDLDSTHSADVDYAELLPILFQLRAGNFYLQLASEKNRPRVLGTIRELIIPDQKIFVGVIDPLDPAVESAEVVRDRVLEAAKFIKPEQLGTTDDCGFSPFGDDLSTARETAFKKIIARVKGTALAAMELGI